MAGQLLHRFSGKDCPLYERRRIDAGRATRAGAEQELKTAANFSDKDVAALAKMALASMYRTSNRTPEAIAIYKDLSEHPTATVSKSQPQLELAEIYETTDPQQAALIYQQLQKEDPGARPDKWLAQKLAKVKVTLPATYTWTYPGPRRRASIPVSAATFAAGFASLLNWRHTILLPKSTRSMTMKSFLAGLGIGIGLGILFAPMSGEETRENLSHRAGDLADSARDLVGQGRERVRTTVSAIGEGRTLCR